VISVAADPYPLVIAHRGGGDEAPENSFTAFSAMHELGVRYIETDAHLTADDVVVLNHDEVIDRTYDGEGRISEMTYEEICQYRNSAGETMPRLVDALESFPELFWNIDAKSDDVVDPLLEILAEREAFGRVLLASFSEKRLNRIRDCEEPELTTSLGVPAVVRLMLASETVSAAETWRVDGPHQHVRAVQVPEKMKGIRVVNPRFVATAHTAGLAVHVWTVNEPDAMVRLLDWRVDGLITDRPTMLREILKARGQWRDPQPMEA